MPELPDIDVYISALRERIVGRRIDAIELRRPFLLRTVEPGVADVPGHRVIGLRRIGKRIAIGVESDFWLVLHLMIAGRLHWHATAPKRWKASTALVIAFENGKLSLTEAGTKQRASLSIVRGDTALGRLDPGGLECMSATQAEFAAALRRENHTLKRALTDPTILSGMSPIRKEPN